jgi:hypothetical protein
LIFQFLINASQTLGDLPRPVHIEDLSSSRLLPCNLTARPHSAGDKSLL